MATPELPALKAYLPRLVDKHLDLDFIRKNASSCNARTRATRRSNPGMRFKHRRSARPALNAATAPVISSNSARPPSRSGAQIPRRNQLSARLALTGVPPCPTHKYKTPDEFHRAFRLHLTSERARRQVQATTSTINQAENEEPQPQVLVAFGFRITNWEPSRPSV